MILYVCPDNPRPSGGVRVIYRHVDILNRHGIDAAVLHDSAGFRPTWFAHSTTILYREQIRQSPDDVLVLPEICGPDMTSLAPGVRKVIFNQNVYSTFYGYRFNRNLTTAYTHGDVIAGICVSDDSRRYLEMAFANLKLFRIHLSIDPSRFYPAEKWPRIAFMPRRHSDHAIQVLNVLQLRGKLDDFELFPIDNMNEDEAAAALREALIFLSFGLSEGFGLPPAEAMACGCVVVGYHGFGGREFFLPDHSFPVESGDICGYVEAVERVLWMYRNKPGELAAIGERAAEFIRRNYPPEQEERDLVQCWGAILAQS